MAFRKSSDTRPQILEVSPEAAIPGGELRIRGKNFAGADWPHVRFGELAAPLVIGLPVGFVGAVAAKAALRASGLPAVSNRSERGGAAVAAAAVNALLYADPAA
jgi:hypothetical protein